MRIGEKKRGTEGQLDGEEEMGMRPAPQEKLITLQPSISCFPFTHFTFPFTHFTLPSPPLPSLLHLQCGTEDKSG